MGLERKREAARRRWALLARALHNSRNHPDVKISVRRISNFGLLDIKPLVIQQWYLYTIKGEFTLKIRHLNPIITPEDLMGFNNTGNICVWPSEEVLAYYISHVRHIFSGKSVLELGGGMTCLAGLFIAKYTEASRVYLTDGNSASIDNVKQIVKENGFDESKIMCSVLKWDSLSSAMEFDIVLAADCLFFDESRRDLALTMWKCIKTDGFALVTAPRRGRTLDIFLQEAVQMGFQFSLTEYYDPQVWERHLNLQSNCPYYDVDIHYPLLIQLYKKKSV